MRPASAPASMRGAEDWIRQLGLEPHPEGGHFRESYRASEILSVGALPPRFAGDRAAGTAILYLLGAGERSRLHRLLADEVWHFYEGGPLVLHLLRPDGSSDALTLGRDLDRGERLQIVVPRGVWFGAEPAPGSAFSLVGCTVAPGFDYRDFELGRRDALVASFPAQRALIERMTDPSGGAGG